jgi:hypothetical protein
MMDIDMPEFDIEYARSYPDSEKSHQKFLKDCYDNMKFLPI